MNIISPIKLIRKAMSKRKLMSSTPHCEIAARAAVMSLECYWHCGQWVFDDEHHGLQAEAFVCGMSEIITQALRDNDIDPKDVRDGFRLTFSPYAYPKHTHSLTWTGEAYDGNTYICDQNKMEGWLCPALFCYFDNAPEKLYFHTDRIEE